MKRLSLIQLIAERSSAFFINLNFLNIFGNFNALLSTICIQASTLYIQSIYIKRNNLAYSAIIHWLGF